MKQPLFCVSLFFKYGRVKAKNIHKGGKLKGAEKARATIYKETTFPSPQRFINLLNSNYFRNYPITSADARRATDIYGSVVAYLKGKTTRNHPVRVDGVPNALMPQSTQDRHTEATMCTDVFYVHSYILSPTT